MQLNFDNMLFLYKYAGLSLPIVRASEVVIEDRVFKETNFNSMRIIYQKREPVLSLVQHSYMCMGDRVMHTPSGVLGYFDDWHDNRTGFTVCFEASLEKSRQMHVSGPEMDNWVLMDPPDNDPLIPGELVVHQLSGVQGEFIRYTLDGTLMVLLDHDELEGVPIDKDDALNWVSA